MQTLMSPAGLARRPWALVAVAGAILLSGVLVIRAAAATLSVTTTTLHDGAVGQTYDPATLAASGGSTPYLWSVVGGASALPAGLSLSSAGALSGTPTTLGSTTFIVKVTDNASNTATKELTVKVNPPVVVQTTALPSVIVSTAYPSTQLVATGGTGTYTWALNSGSGPLPTGLTLSAAGVLSGTPTATGTFNFTVKATDAANHSDLQDLSILVTAAGALTITTASLPNGVQGTAYPAQTITATGGTGSYTWTVDSGSLPGGLTFTPSATTASITGTPSATGTFNFTLKVVDGAAATVTKQFTINVMAAVDITTSSPLPAATAGAAYSTVLAASGGTPPYTWTATPPAGLTMSATTGAITGTPSTAGTTSFNVQVTDFFGYTKTESFNLTVNPAPAPNITTTSLPNALASADYTQQLFKTGGTPADIWSLLTGAPAGLSISATGLLTWTPAPATLATHTFSVQVTGSAGTDTQQLSLTVSNTAQPPNQGNQPGANDDDDRFHGQCNAFFRGSENGRKHKSKATAFMRLIDAAGASGEWEAVVTKVRDFCNQNSGYWHWHDGDDDDDEEMQSSSNRAKNKGKSNGRGHRD
jgi:hypothetical protein